MPWTALRSRSPILGDICASATMSHAAPRVADMCRMRQRTHLRAPLVLTLAAVLLTAALIPFCTRNLGVTTSYLPAVLAMVTCFDVMSLWLLCGEYADTGDRRMLAMAAAYLWSLCLMAGYALAFPGVFSAHPPLAETASVAPYLYIGWHAGFPILLGLAWSPWAALDVTDARRRRTATIWWTTAAAVGAAGCATAACVAFARRLPVLIHGMDTTAMTQVTAPIALPLVALALALSARSRSSAGTTQRWTQVTVAVCMCDLVLTYCAHHRYSLGWYAGRSMTVTAAVVVLIAMLASFRRLKSTAEFNAAYDALTGLSNRRSSYDALAAMLARSQRMGTRLSVVLFDLDHFKQVNDAYGHAGGDTVLRNVANTLRATVRDSDIVGRIGGEEFLMLLPDAGGRDAEVVVDRLRAALRLTVTSSSPAGITASFGIATLQAGDSAAAFVARADQAMYAAKAAGRDRYAHATAAAALSQDSRTVV